MLGKSIAGRSNELTVMGIPKGVHKEGFCRLRAAFFPPNPSKGMGPQKGRMMGLSSDLPICAILSVISRKILGKVE